MIQGYPFGDFYVTERWHDRPKPVLGLHCTVENSSGDEVVIGPPGAEADWPSREAAARWFSRSVDALIGFGMSESRAEDLLLNIYGSSEKSPN